MELKKIYSLMPATGDSPNPPEGEKRSSEFSSFQMTREKQGPVLPPPVLPRPSWGGGQVAACL